MAEPQFQHEHLRLSEGSIRLVQIHGSTNKAGPLSLRITQFATSRRPPYAAISYTWGSASRSVPVTINGKPFTIRPNLYQLLFHLRQRGESRFLWVDALCINQTNDSERNFHVQFMSRIYEEAELAIVWLGLPSDDRREARAIDFLVEMADHRPNKAGIASFRDLYFTEKAQPRWINLLSFCKCTYWSRTWIIQEFVQAKRIEVFCGKATLNWSAFETVHQNVKSLFPSNVITSSLPLILQDILRLFLTTIPSRLTSRRLSHTASLLVELLHEFYDAQCTLPRDKVYGMLGIAADCGHLITASTDPSAASMYRGPVPDYAKHIVDVYFDVTTYLRDSSPTHSVAPLTVLLLQKSLGITEQSIMHFIKPMSPETVSSIIANTTLHLKPDYISTIAATLPAYTSPADLRQKLAQFDWSPYVGFEIVRPRTPNPSTQMRPSRPSAIPFRSSSNVIPPNPSALSTSTLSPPASTTPHRRNSSSSTLSRQITQTTPLPDDLIPNAVALASSPLLSSDLRSYPYTTTTSPNTPTDTPINLRPHDHTPNTAFHLPLSPTILSLAPHEKSIIPNIRPTAIVETSPLAQPLRLGFTTPNVRRNDLILQFSGLDITLVGRRLGSSGKLQLIGRAIMVTHAGLRCSRFMKEAEVHPACSTSNKETPISPCLTSAEDFEALNDGRAGRGRTEVIEDQEKAQWQEQWREQLKSYEDVEIETDALSLYEILRDA